VKSVFVSYDGLLEPLGQSQVLPYALKLVSRGASLGILSFEKPSDLADTARVASLERDLQEMGVVWRRFRYHKRPAVLATGYDVLRGTVAAVAMARRLQANIIHARSYVPAVMAWLARRWVPASLLFDMRGFWVDERVEGGLWRRDSALYRAGKWWERRLLRGADGVIVLASAAVPHLEVLAGRPLQAPVGVIPSCVDLERFRPRNRTLSRASLGLAEGTFVLLYVGSLGTWYLGPETFALAGAVASQVESFTLVVLTRDAGRARELLPPSLTKLTRVLAVSHDEVPRWMAAADAGMSLIRPTFSKTASCPTKLGEYLACGLPVAATRGIGDVERILNQDIGVLITDCDGDSLADAARRLVTVASRPETWARCRAVAEEHFSLEDGADRFLGLYRQCAPPE
jgi:glycosyltransferase involved in cell wall biosynthesis